MAHISKVYRRSHKYSPVSSLLCDSSRHRSYVPRNPYVTPECFTTVPLAGVDDVEIFSKFDTDALFFIFYFQQGSYQQVCGRAKQLIGGRDVVTDAKNCEARSNSV